MLILHPHQRAKSRNLRGVLIQTPPPGIVFTGFLAWKYLSTQYTAGESSFCRHARDNPIQP